MIILQNLISFSTIFLLPIILISYYLTNSSIFLYGLTGISLTLILTSILKNFVFPSNLRPIGAKDCNVFNRDGDVSHEPGFPSGHTATASFFVFFYIYILYQSYKRGEISRNILITGISGLLLYLFLIGYSRYEKKCHSIPQILGGLFFGLGMSFLSIFLYSWIKKFKLKG